MQFSVNGTPLIVSVPPLMYTHAQERFCHVAGAIDPLNSIVWGATTDSATVSSSQRAHVAKTRRHAINNAADGPQNRKRMV
jgi:hypothetical protein